MAVILTKKTCKSSTKRNATSEKYDILLLYVSIYIIIIVINSMRIIKFFEFFHKTLFCLHKKKIGFVVYIYSPEYQKENGFGIFDTMSMHPTRSTSLISLFYMILTNLYANLANIKLGRLYLRCQLTPDHKETYCRILHTMTPALGLFLPPFLSDFAQFFAHLKKIVSFGIYICGPK